MRSRLSAAEARRVFLAAQGLARSRPRKRAREAEFSAYLERQGVLQLDSVNVLERAHYLPLFSRHGAYAKADLDGYLWGDAEGHSAHCFEHWGHEASVMPLDVLPLMHHRMSAPQSYWPKVEAAVRRDHPGLIEKVAAAVAERGPLTSGDLDHLAPRETKRGEWWDGSPVKAALEHLFMTGQVARTRGRHFTVSYDATPRAWAAAPAPAADWGASPAAAKQALFDRALAAYGIGTVKDLCDHYRLRASDAPSTAGPGKAAGRGWAESAVERGLAEWVDVGGWDEPALLAAAAQDPGRATASTLLSPFDPVCWFRPRLQRMFGMDYKIEIYTPAAKRRYGYYVLPFLMGDQMAARVDLKADRKTRTLRVLASWREANPVPGIRRRPPEAVAEALARELRELAAWLELEEIEVDGRGDLAAALENATTDKAMAAP